MLVSTSSTYGHDTYTFQGGIFLKFTSRRDVWLSFILFGIISYGIYLSFSAFMTGKTSYGEIIFTVCLNSVIIFFICWLWFSTYYVLEEKNLVIPSGPINKRIPYREITSAHKTWKPLSSPALSLKRIHITYQFENRAYFSKTSRPLLANAKRAMLACRHQI
jgi:Bacterial PH domain